MNQLINREKWLRVRAVLKGGVCILVLALVAKYVNTNWQAVETVRLPRPQFLLPASALGLLALFGVSYICRSLLALHGVSVSYFKAIGLFFVPMLGKYVPGKMWSILGAVWIYSREGVPKQIAVACIALITLIAVISATVVGVPLSVQRGLASAELWIFGGVSLALLAGAQPRVFYPLGNFLLRLFGRQPIPRSLSSRDLLYQLLAHCALWLLYGAGFYFLVVSVTEASISHLPQVCGIFALAQVAGFVALFAPAGIGVREGVLIGGLSPIVGAGPAIVVAGVARLWQTALELLMAGIGWWALRKRPMEGEHNDEALRSLGPASSEKSGDGRDGGIEKNS